MLRGVGARHRKKGAVERFETLLLAEERLVVEELEHVYNIFHHNYWIGTNLKLNQPKKFLLGHRHHLHFP